MKTRIQLLIIGTLIGALTVGCEPAPDAFLVRHFLIEKGEHYSTPRLVETLQSDRLIFTAEFNESAMYDLHDAAMQTNKNKLLGFSDCNSLHHENSARFAWQWYNNQLEIYAYCYVNSERIEKFVGTIKINEPNQFKIVLKKDAYLFYLNDLEPISIVRKHADSSGLYYILWPYFGGTMPAPAQVRIDVAIKPS